VLSRFASVVLAIALIGGFIATAIPAPRPAGIVLLHGKTGEPAGRPGHVAVIAELAASLERAGYLVEQPEMCWSGARIYDEAYPDCFKDIDAAVARLKARGAGAVVVAGMSLGGNAAIGYGASHTGLAGIIAVAPAAAPEAMKRPDIARGVALARGLVAAGKGGAKTEFTDVAVGQSFHEQVTPAVYLSFHAPEGPANMAANIARLKAPLLMVSGSDDPTQPYARSLFPQAPADPLNRLVIVTATHLSTPTAGIGTTLSWLGALLGGKPVLVTFSR
jgi:pimeloyl-ACP methyl ester carboxylesterase